VRAWHIVRSRLRSLVFRGGRESDLNEELQFHLERETERLQASGLSREDARLQALRLFGGVEQIKEASRDARGTAAFDALARDTRYAVRRLLRDWRFTTAAVLILGLAIGANTAIFSVVNAVLFRDSPFADPIASSTSIRTIPRASRSWSSRTTPTRRWRSTPTSLRRRWPPRFRFRPVISTKAAFAVEPPSTRRRPISMSLDSGRRSAGGSTRRRNGRGRRLSPSSGIRHGRECSARIPPSSDASFGLKARR
jgi:hypothetical protein